MKNFKKFIFVLIVSALPIVSFAQTTNKPCDATVNNAGDILCRIGNILNMVIPFLVGLAVIIFVWGVILFVISDDEEAKTKGRDRIIFGIIGLAVIIGLWGLVRIVNTTFGIDNSSSKIAVDFIQSNSTLIQKASGNCDLSTIAHPKLGDVLNYGTCLISNSVVPLIFALAVLLFVWGVVQYVINSDEEAKKEKGRQFMIWGIVALAVMVSVWGIVRIFGQTFNINYAIPQVQDKAATSP